MSKQGKMTPSAAIRIQAGTAKNNGGTVQKNSFASRAQSAAAKNVNGGIVKSKSQFFAGLIFKGLIKQLQYICLINPSYVKKYIHSCTKNI